MGGNMIAAIASDFILRFGRGGVMPVTHVEEIAAVDGDDVPAHPAGF